MIEVIKRQTGAAFRLHKGQKLRVIDPNGEQVSDMVLFNAKDTREKISSGKTLDFEESILISQGDHLWSNRSNKMMEILEAYFLWREFPLETFLDILHACLPVKHVEDGKFLFMKTIVIQPDRFLDHPVGPSLVLVSTKGEIGAHPQGERPGGTTDQAIGKCRHELFPASATGGARQLSFILR